MKGNEERNKSPQARSESDDDDHPHCGYIPGRENGVQEARGGQRGPANKLLFVCVTSRVYRTSKLNRKLLRQLILIRLVM